MPYVQRHIPAEKMRPYKKFQDENPKLVIDHFRETIALNDFIVIPGIDGGPQIVFDDKKHQGGDAHHQ